MMTAIRQFLALHLPTAIDRQYHEEDRIHYDTMLRSNLCGVVLYEFDVTLDGAPKREHHIWRREGTGLGTHYVRVR